MKSDDAVARLVRLGGALVMFGSAAIAIYTIGQQIYHYLQFAEWRQLGLMDFIAKHVEWEWAAFPTSWIGLHELFNQLNAGTAILIVGLVIGGWLIGFENQ